MFDEEVGGKIVDLLHDSGISFWQQPLNQFSGKLENGRSFVLFGLRGGVLLSCYVGFTILWSL